jgi:hypothetical protein
MAAEYCFESESFFAGSIFDCQLQKQNKTDTAKTVFFNVWIFTNVIV